MSEWTQLQALKVLETGDWLNVEHPSFPGETLTVRKTQGGKFVAYRNRGVDQVGEVYDTSADDPVAGEFSWGEFEVVGFCWFPSFTGGKPAEEEIDKYAWARFEDEVLGKDSHEEG